MPHELASNSTRRCMDSRERRLPLAWVLVFVAGCVNAPAPRPVEASVVAPASATVDGAVVVSYGHNACFSSESIKFELKPVADTYASESLVVPRSLIEAARKAAYASRGAALDVLTDFGIDSEQLDAAPAKIAEALLPDSGYAERTTSEEWAQAVRESVTRADIIQALESHIDSSRARSFPVASCWMHITLPGDPPISITHSSFSIFYLPWRVVAGEQQWTTSDVRLTRALAPLIWTDRTFDEFVAQWRERVFSYVLVWYELEARVAAVLNRRLYSAMRGFAQAADDWRIHTSGSGESSLWDGEALWLELRAQHPRSVDAIRWRVPLVEHRPAHDWNDLLKLAEVGERAVATRPWLEKWKWASTCHSLELQAVGAQPHDPQLVDESVLQSWREAGLPGSPEIQILLRSREREQATVYLSGNDASGLVLASQLQPAPGHVLFAISSVQGAKSFFDADGNAHALP